MSDSRQIAPADYMPDARQLVRRRNELVATLKQRGPENVADSDRAEAALFERLGMDMQARELDPGQARFFAWGFAVSAAVIRRIPPERRCPHARPEARRPLTALLSSRLMFCDECEAEFASRFTVGEGQSRCDMCDREATRFSEFAGTIVSWRVIGNVCDECGHWFESLPQVKR